MNTNQHVFATALEMQTPFLESFLLQKKKKKSSIFKRNHETKKRFLSVLPETKPPLDNQQVQKKSKVKYRENLEWSNIVKKKQKDQ